MARVTLAAVPIGQATAARCGWRARAGCCGRGPALSRPRLAGPLAARNPRAAELDFRALRGPALTGLPSRAHEHGERPTHIPRVPSRGVRSRPQRRGEHMTSRSCHKVDKSRAWWLSNCRFQAWLGVLMESRCDSCGIRRSVARAGRGRWHAACVGGPGSRSGLAPQAASSEEPFSRGRRSEGVDL